MQTPEAFQEGFSLLLGPFSSLVGQAGRVGELTALRAASSLLLTPTVGVSGVFSFLSRMGPILLF